MNWIEQIGPDHVLARLEVGWRPTRLRPVPVALALASPVVAALASRWFPHRPGMEGLLCYGAMVWTWTLIGVVLLGAWNGQSVVPLWEPRPRRVEVEVRGGRITVDGAELVAVEVSEQRLVVAGRQYHLIEPLSPEDVALLESAFSESLQLDRRRTGGQVPEDLSRLREGVRE